MSGRTEWVRLYYDEHLTSSKIRRVKDLVDETILLPHEAMRGKIRELREVMTKVVMCQKWRTDLFYRWFRSCLGPFMEKALTLEIHLIQRLDKRGSRPLGQKEGEIAEELFETYKECMELIDEVYDCHRWFKETKQMSKNPTRRLDALIRDVGGAVDNLTKRLEEHLARVEEVIPAMTRRKFGYRNGYEKAVEEYVQGIKLADAAVLLPSLLEAADKWMTDEGKKKGALGKITQCTAWLNTNFWQNNYSHRNKTMLDDLRGDVPPACFRYGCC
ncbi:unnamed protein product [Vitrella brassicaformis CCMP3155]|uniref:Uncharacterized protein n=1 Tax=Vitrella brassicaformis (strain CCMP3155) TaxID=1169540 RepID=A0A0G4EMJ7_VITBC|nr:unnamed protein product [Vitrella brassicaformis CCMP3155]|eukprot:CEL98670.1 unnamed protein product [Vitrella brassicaformis CCMP3155]